MTALSNFPAAALQEFATRFPGTVVEERFRVITYSAGVIVGEAFGIEAETASDATGFEAQYGADGSFVASVTTTHSMDLPLAVTDTLNSLYPGVSFDEREMLVDDNGAVTYQVELDAAQSGVELTIDSNGTLLESAEDIQRVQVPLAVVNGVQQVVANGQAAEYELLTDRQSGVATYGAELEGKEESVSLEYDEAGNLLVITLGQEM